MIRVLHGIGGRPAHIAPLLDALGHGNSEDAADASPALLGHGDAVPAAPAPTGGAADPAAEADHDWILTAARDWAARAGDGAGPDLLIGHSTGGVIALRALAEGLVRPRGLVVIDSNVPVDAAALAARADKARLAAAPDWRDRLRASLARDLLAPKPWPARILADLDATADHPMRALWGAVLTADPRPLWAAASVPVLYVRSTRQVHQADLDKLTDRARVVDVSAHAGGHWPHLADPAGVARAIRDWRAETGV